MPTNYGVRAEPPWVWLSRFAGPLWHRLAAERSSASKGDRRKDTQRTHAHTHTHKTKGGCRERERRKRRGKRKKEDRKRPERRKGGEARRGKRRGGKEKKKTRIGAELLTLVTASSDGTISTGKSDICLSLAEMFARQLRRDGRETQACSEAKGNEN